MIVKSVGVASVAKIYAAISAGIGLVVGVCIALASMVGAGFAANAENNEMSFLAPLFGIGAVIALPIFYGVMGLIGGAIGAALYNLFAGMVGGIRVETD